MPRRTYACHHDVATAGVMTHNCSGARALIIPPNAAALFVDVVLVTDRNLVIEWFTMRGVYSQRHGCQSRTAQRRDLPSNEVILHGSNVVNRVVGDVVLPL